MECIGGVIGYAEFKYFGGKVENYTSDAKTLSDLSAEVCIRGTSAANVGGVIGHVYGATLIPSRSYPHDCYSRVEMSGLRASVNIDCTGSSFGGVIGYISRRATDSYRYSNSTTYYSHPTEFTLESSFAIGDIKTDGANAGGVIGSCEGTEIDDCYFAGSVVGGENVGGITGTNGKISHCYTSAVVSGSKNVGGISGSNSRTIKTSFALCPSIAASQSNVGRIYGAGSPTCGAIGTPETNYSLVGSKVSVNGREEAYNATKQDGDQSSMETMKMRATYQGLGWDFAKEWTLLETECLPYKHAQTAPPIMLSTPTSGSFIVSGKSTDDGVVYLQYDGQIFTATATKNTWTVRTDPLKAGEKLTIWAKCDGKFRSYNMTYTVAYPGSGTAEDPYQIYTVGDLANINGAGYYKLMNDIDLTGVAWEPIGRTAAVMTVLDGDNYTIKGLKVNQSGTNYCGLFSAISGSIIKNLTIEGASVTGKDYCGILAGSLTNCTIENVKISDSSVNGKNYCGGIAGNVNATSFTDVSMVESTVSGGNYAGGITGNAGTSSQFTLTAFRGDITGSGYVGGIVGYNAESTVTRSSSEGTVTGTGTNTYAGGITGYNKGSITDCFSTADITSTGYTGGIAGINYAEISRCYASGDLNSDTLAAGITAYNDGANATVDACAVASEYIRIASQTGNGMRVLGGIRNSAPIPETSANRAFKDMIVSVNGVPQEIYDDPMNGTGTLGDALRTQTTYTDMGWKFTSVWKINGSAMPELTGLSATGTSRNDNYYYAEGHIVASGDIFELSICLRNRDVVTGAQFDMTLPAGMTIYEYYDEDEEEDVLSILPGARMTRNHTIIKKAQPDGSMRVGIVATRSATPLTGDDGEIVKIKVKVDESVVNGNYYVRFKNGYLDSNASSIAMSPFSISVKIVNDSVGADNTEIMRGKTGSVNVNMNNKSEINGMQFDVFLPSGIEFATNADGDPAIYLGSRAQASHILETKKLESGATRVVIFAGDASSLFAGNEGDIVNYELAVPENMEEGTYTIAYKNVYLANRDLKSVECSDFISLVNVTRMRRKGDVNIDGIITVSDITGAQTLSLGKTNDQLDLWAADVNSDNVVNAIDVKEVNYLVLDEVFPQSAPRRVRARAEANEPVKPVFNDAVSLFFESLVIEPGQTIEVGICMTNPTTKVSLTQFDMHLPEGFSFELTDEAEGTMWAEESERSANFNLVTWYNKDQDVYRVSHVNIALGNYKKKSGAILYFRLKADENVKPGVYTALRSGFEFLDDIDTYFYGPDEPFSIIVGDGSTLRHIELNGHINETVAATLSEGVAANENLLSLDLTGVVETPEGATFTSANPNTVVFVNEGQNLSASTNIVTAGRCSRLVLVDGHPFGVTREFNVDEAVYSREMAAGELASLYLPFANQDEIGVEFGAETWCDYMTKALSYTAVEHIAHAPCLVYAAEGGTKVFRAENVTISPVATMAESSRMFGSYEHADSDDEVYKVDNGVLVPTTRLEPFRSYFTNEVLSGITGINDAVIDINASTEIYNLMGVKMNVTIDQLAPGFYIIGGKKVYVK